MTTDACAVEACHRPCHAKGYCNAHYRRLLETGDVDAERPLLPMPSPRATIEERLAARSTRAPSGCLEWTGARNRHGYGTASFGRGRKEMVHRVAWEIENGPIAPGAHLDHACGNPACREVSHLRVVTPAENVQYRTRLDSTNTSGYRGVYRTRSGRWTAMARKDRKRYYLGTYDTAEEAGAVAAEWRAENYKLGEFDDRAA